MFGCFSACRLDGLINLARRKLVRALALGFLADYPEYFRLGRGKAHIVADTEQHGALGMPRFSITSERCSSCTRRNSLPKPVRALRAETITLLFLSVLIGNFISII